MWNLKVQKINSKVTVTKEKYQKYQDFNEIAQTINIQLFIHSSVLWR